MADNQVVHRTTAADAAEAVALYTVYERPLDYPQHYVVRCWRIVAGVQEPVPELDPVIVADTLEGARSALPNGLTRFARSPTDDRCIVESWI